eukprot:g18466.t1
MYLHPMCYDAGLCEQTCANAWLIADLGGCCGQGSEASCGRDVLDGLRTGFTTSRVASQSARTSAVRTLDSVVSKAWLGRRPYIRQAPHGIKHFVFGSGYDPGKDHSRACRVHPIGSLQANEARLRLSNIYIDAPDNPSTPTALLDVPLMYHTAGRGEIFKNIVFDTFLNGGHPFVSVCFNRAKDSTFERVSEALSALYGYTYDAETQMNETRLRSGGARALIEGRLYSERNSFSDAFAKVLQDATRVPFRRGIHATPKDLAILLPGNFTEAALQFATCYQIHSSYHRVTLFSNGAVAGTPHKEMLDASKMLGTLMYRKLPSAHDTNEFSGRRAADYQDQTNNPFYDLDMGEEDDRFGRFSSVRFWSAILVWNSDARVPPYRTLQSLRELLGYGWRSGDRFRVDYLNIPTRIFAISSDPAAHSALLEEIQNQLGCALHLFEALLGACSFSEEAELQRILGPPPPT